MTFGRKEKAVGQTHGALGRLKSSAVSRKNRGQHGHSVGKRGGGSGILVDDELARAIKHESAAALMHWWGVSTKTVWQWRKTFNIDRAGTPGSKRLIGLAAQKALDAAADHEWTTAERRARRRRAITMKLGRNLILGYHGPRWSNEQLAMLPQMSDAQIAARTGRSKNAVRIMRQRLGLPGCGIERRKWTKEELRLLGKLPYTEVARLTGRTPNAVSVMRAKVGTYP
jgi:hypothetical protein